MCSTSIANSKLDTSMPYLISNYDAQPLAGSQGKNMTQTTNQPLSHQAQFDQTQALLAFEQDISTVNQKTALTSIAHVKGSAINVDIDKLHFQEDFNPRIKDADHYAHIRTIADSIKSEGFYADKPLAGIVGFVGKRAVIFITDGRCRLEATHLAISEGAPIDDLPVVLKDRTTTREDLTVALVRSNSGKKFKPLELAVIVKRLFKFGWPAQMIADRLGFTPEYVNQLLTIAGAPSTIRQMIQDGEVPAAVAIQTLRTHGDEAATVLVQAVKAAKSNGQSGITRKHLPEQIRKKAITKAAPSMMTIIERVKTDATFQNLPTDLQDLIDKIIQMVAATTSAAAPTATEEEQT